MAPKPGHTPDFLLTLVFTTVVDQNQPPSEVFSKILSIYNEDYCEEIEEDTSIRITIDVE